MSNVSSESLTDTQAGLPTEKNQEIGHLNDQELHQVTGGVSDIAITKPTDSTSPK